MIVENIKEYENSIGKVYMTELKNVPPVQNDYPDPWESYCFLATIHMDSSAPQEHPISTVSLDDFLGYFFCHPLAAFQEGRTQSCKYMLQSTEMP